MNITLKQVRAFLEVARLNSFTRASTHLNASQSSLSVIIRELEIELDTRLLDRTTRRVELTEAGREFVPFMERMLAELDHGVQATREIAERQRGRVSVGATPLAAAALLPRAISRFQALYPGISVVMEEVAPDYLSTRVANSLFDCGVGVFDAKDDGVTATPIFNERLLLVCARKHPLAAKREVKWSELAQYPLITVTPDSAVRRRLDRFLALGGISVRPAFEVKQMITMLGMVDAKLGVAIWPSWAVSLTRSYDLELRPLIRPKAVHVVSVVTSKSRAISPAVEAFIGSLKDYSRLVADEAVT